jgi:hypothetical protein
VISDHFQDTRTNPLPWLGLGVFSAKLRDTERHADAILDGFGKVQQIAPG